MKQSPKTVAQLKHRLRPEFQRDVFDVALESLDQAGKLTRQGELLKLAPAPRVLRHPQRDDGGDGLFPMPQQRVPPRKT